MNVKAVIWLVAGILVGFSANELTSRMGNQAVGLGRSEPSSQTPASSVGDGSPQQMSESAPAPGDRLLPTMNTARPPPPSTIARPTIFGAGAEAPPDGPPEMFIPADGEAAQRIADEAYTGADEMAAAMTLNGANEEEIEALYEMARFLESQAAAKAYGEIEQESGPESLSLEEQASEAKQSLTDAGAPEEMVRHVEQTLLTPATGPELPLDPRTLHADLPH